TEQVGRGAEVNDVGSESPGAGDDIRHMRGEEQGCGPARWYDGGANRRGGPQGLLARETAIADEDADVVDAECGERAALLGRCHFVDLHDHGCPRLVDRSLPALGGGKPWHNVPSQER